MADIEKVKQGCECCDHIYGERKCRECPYKQFPKPYCNIQLAHDTLSVIARLQPKKGKWIFTGQKNAYGGTVIQCPFCDDKYAVSDPGSEHFCRNCGAKLAECFSPRDGEWDG